jgi:hypothetical protein
MNAACFCSHWHDRTGPHWKVGMFSGLNASMFPGKGAGVAQVDGIGGNAFAVAVVDDFGDLVIVGRWS